MNACQFLFTVCSLRLADCFLRFAVCGFYTCREGRGTWHQDELCARTYRNIFNTKLYICNSFLIPNYIYVIHLFDALRIRTRRSSLQSDPGGINPKLCALNPKPYALNPKQGIDFMYVGRPPYPGAPPFNALSGGLRYSNDKLTLSSILNMAQVFFIYFQGGLRHSDDNLTLSSILIMAQDFSLKQMKTNKKVLHL